MTSPPGDGEAITLPKNETQQYRCIDLENGLKAVLVHDPEADKAAASLDVNVGSMLDPVGFPGLAHFTEHMLFYSSEKYPVEDEYSKFVSDHGGSTNAWTAAENTNYQFDVNWDNLEEALDRFAQFFTCPLISADGVDREVKAVDSEHSKNIDSDAWRLMQLHKHTANQLHPWSKFFTGNNLTLGVQPKEKGLDIRQGVEDFYNKWYSSNLMRLAVISRHSLDELEAMVRADFSSVKNKELEVPKMPDDVFLPEHCCKLMSVIPVRDSQSLEFAWQVPPSTPVYRASPLNYLSHLLGHEGTGSLFAVLKQLGWASSLVAGESSLSISSSAFFYVRVELTKEGFNHPKEISSLLFKYLSILKGAEGVNEEIFKEMQVLQRLRFDFRDKMSPYNAATGLSSALQLYPPADLLLAIYHVPMEYQPDVIREAVEMMSAERVRVTFTAKELGEGSQFEANLAEPWYGTKYSLQGIPEDWLEAWASTKTDSSLHLPEPNPFVPTDFTLHTEEATGKGEPPVLAADIPGRMGIYHKCDLTFSMPKANVYLDFHCPEAYASPDNVVMTRLYVKLLEDYLNEMAYPAELAGLSYGVHNSQAGFQLIVSGYNHKLLTLLDSILNKMVHFEMKEDRFAIVKENVAKEYTNIKYQQPYSWVMYRKELLVSLKRWQVDDYIESIKDVTPEDVTLFVKKTMLRCFVQGLVVGNMPRAEVVTLSEHICKQMTEVLNTKPIFPAQAVDYRTVKLPQGVTTLLAEPGPNPQNDNSAVIASYQVGPDNLRRNVLTQLLVHLGKRDAFNQLRTQQQLGYIVSMFTNHDLCTYSIEVVVQSNQFSAATLCDRIETFIQSFVTEMLVEKCKVPEVPADGVGEDKVTMSEFAKAIEELRKTKLEKPKTLGEITRKMWHEVMYGTAVFNRQEAEVAELDTITPEELREFATSVLGPETRRKLIVAAQGSAERIPASETPEDKAPPASEDKAPPAAEDKAPPAAEDKAPPAAEDKAPPADPPSADAADAAAADKSAKNSVDFTRGGAEALFEVDDISMFKRSCEVWPNVAASYLMKRKEQQKK